MGQGVIEAILGGFKTEETEDLLARLIAIESHQDAPRQELELAEFIAGWLADRGVVCALQEVLPNRKNVVACVKGSGEGPTLLLNGHLDTVPAYGMQHPFAPYKWRGRLYGRGSVDMKGALAAMMCTMSVFAKADGKLSGDLIFAGTVGEETYSPGAYQLTSDGFAADYAIVGEPTGLSVGVAHKGVAWYEAEFYGVSVHGSVPDQGINAIYSASRWISHLQDRYIPLLRKRYHDLLGSPTINVGTIEGGTRPVIVPNRCVVRFERRLLPGETAESALVELRDLLSELRGAHPELNAEIRIMDNFHGVPHGPLQTPPNSRLTTELLKSYEKELQPGAGTVPAPKGLQFWTDGALLQQCCRETVVCGPGHIEQAHSDEEYIEIDQLHRAARMYVRAAFALCGPWSPTRSAEGGM